MQAFTTHTGTVLPFDRTNVDTDAILPKQYLKSIKLQGYSDWLFDDERYLDPGDVNTPISTRRVNPEFVLNFPRYQGASIILAGDNFGCGSSREHAVWALRDYGIRAIIAPSFADIFYNNCFKNGLLPLALSKDEVAHLFHFAAVEQAIEVTVDLQQQQVVCGRQRWQFTVDPARRNRLLSGKDDIAVTLGHAEEIRQFERKVLAAEPWLDI